MDLAELQTLRVELAAALSRLDRLLDGRNDRSSDALAEDDPLSLPRTKAIEWALGQSPTPMRPVEIHAALHRIGRDDPKMEVQVTTYDLWKRGRIDKVGVGQYRTKR